MKYNVIYRKKNGGLQAIISYRDINGKWRQKAKQGFGDNRLGKEEAKEWVRDTLSSLELISAIDTNGSRITFSNYVELFVDDHKNIKAPSTIATYKNLPSVFKELSNKPLVSITPVDIQRELNKMEVKESTKKIYLTRIKTMFNYAIKFYKFVAINPAVGVEIKKGNDTRKKALTKEELEKLLSKLVNGVPEHYIGALIAGKAGLRVGEILGLTWGDIDFDKNTINVDKQWKKNKDGKWSFGSVKSKRSVRVVPIAGGTTDKLKAYKILTGGGDGDRIINRNVDSYKTIINAKLKKIAGVTIHELRHTYATMLIASGLNPKAVAYLMGHNVNVTLKVYTHTTADVLKEAVSVIENL